MDLIKHFWYLFQLFSDNLEVVLNFLILQDKHNISKLSLNIQIIFFYMFRKLVQINFIFSDKVRILYIYIKVYIFICLNDKYITNFPSHFIEPTKPC
jgi:hypothetical protein